MSTADEISAMISDCEARESKLNDWERGFLCDIAKRFSERGSLTENQDEKLTTIWERVTE